MSIFRTFIAMATLALMSPEAYADIEFRDQLANLQPIPLRSGVNTIDNFNNDGRTGLVILGWRDNGNAHGYDIFLVMLPTRPGATDWNIVRGPRDDVIRDAPYTGEATIRSVRFLRGQIDGQYKTMLLIAERDIAQSFSEPSRTNISLHTIERGNIGTTYDYFKEVGQFTTNGKYCNAEMAMQTELGLSVRGSYAGPKTPNGCQ